MVKKSAFICVCVWQCAACDITVNSIMPRRWAVYSDHSGWLLNPLHLIHGSYQGKYQEIPVISELFSPLRGIEPRDSLWRWHCTALRTKHHLPGNDIPQNPQPITEAKPRRRLQKAHEAQLRTTTSPSVRRWCALSTRCFLTYISMFIYLFIFVEVNEYPMYIPQHRSCHCNGCLKKSF